MNTPIAPQKQGPLAGVKVLDLSAYIAGPYGCTLLADQGAEVLKVEPPAGDNLRHYPSTLAKESRAFLGVNRSKRGLVLNLKHADDHAVLLHLVRDADVLVHNFRPGVPERLGIAHAQLQALNPRLIHCAITGFGESGPLQHKAGYDQVLQTYSGMCDEQGPHGGAPEILYGSVVDYFTASQVAAGIAAALYEREKSGLGQALSVSLLRAALTMQSARLIWAEGEPYDVARDMRSGGITGLHPTREGYLYLSANTPHFWQALCEHTGLMALYNNPRYDSVKKRALYRDEIVPPLRQALATRSALEWESIFGESVPCAAARRVADMFNDPQVQAEAMLTTLSHPTLGSYRGFAHPWVYSRTPSPAAFAAPTLGQHTAAIRQSGWSTGPQPRSGS